MNIAKLIPSLRGMYSYISRVVISRGAKPYGIARGVTSLLVLGAILVSIALSKAQDAQSARHEVATLSGIVRDSAGNPVSGARVVLTADRSGDKREAITEASGEFSVGGLSSMTFTVTANKGTLHSATVRVVIPPVTPNTAHSSERQMTVNLVLGASTPPRTETGTAEATQLMQFADNPDFAIAAVKDWTAAGGHGSDATLRVSEALTRDALKLPSQKQSDTADITSTEREKKQENELRAAVAGNPNDPAANHKLGEFFLHTRRYQEAVGYLQSAYDEDPANFQNELDLADALKLSGHAASAREHVQKLLTAHETADLHRMKGEIDESLGDPLVAAHQFQLAAGEDPSENNYFAWGSELLIHRAIWQAKEVFDEGARRYPTSVRILTARGATLFAGALYDEAALDLCSASDLDPGLVEPYLFIGKIEIAAPNPLPCALEKLARFQKLQPQNSLSNYYYAMALKKQQGREADQHVLEQVNDLLTKAVALDRNCAVAYLELGNLSAGSRQWNQAINYYLDAIQADQDLSDAHYRLAVAYQRTGRQDLAKEQFQLHDQIAARKAAEVQRQREAVKQFLVVLPDQKNQLQAH